MALPDDFLYQLRMHNPIEDVMNSYVSVKRHGSTYKCLCPFHTEKTPSCTVYKETQSFYCFGCGAGGDVISFIKQIENLNYIEAVRLLAERSGLTMPELENNKKDTSHIKARIYQINRETANFYFLNLIKGNDKRGLDYIKSRSLLPQTVKKYAIGYAPDSWSELKNYLNKKGFTDTELVAAGVCQMSDRGRCYDIFRGRIIFPIVDLRGNVIAFGARKLDGNGPKYLNSSDTLVFKKSRNLFSLNFAKNSASKKLILAEGYMDVISINQAGIENVVATLGTALTSEQARIIAQYASEVIISYDSDEAGQKATQRAVNLLSSAGVSVKIIKIPDAKDPDEYIKKFGSTRFRLLIEKSSDAVKFRLDQCKSGLDINSENDKVKYLHKVVAVISELDDPLQREVYTSAISSETGIKRQVLDSQITKALNSRLKIQKNHEWKAIETNMYKRDEINPESAKYPKETKAEELIILYLMKNSEKINEITQIITAEKFITSFNKRLFSVLCNTMHNFEYFSLSLLSEEFSNEEMGRIAGIEAKNHEITINEQCFSDCVEVLKNFSERLVYNKETEISDDDLINLQNSLRNKKNNLY